MVMFNSYVKLPEGIQLYPHIPQFLRGWIPIDDPWKNIVFGYIPLAKSHGFWT